MTTATGADRTACVLAWFRQSAEGCQKIPEDLARYRDIIGRIRPAVVVETGTGSGRSALWFAEQGCPVITVDMQAWADPLTVSAWQHRVLQITGDSTDPNTAAAVRWAVADREPVLVSLDSDHSAEHVRTEMAFYADLVSPGSYMVVEDSVLGWLPTDSPPRRMFDGTPMEAVGDFLAAHDDWAVDQEIEGMFAATQHPGGWLRRRE